MLRGSASEATGDPRSRTQAEDGRSPPSCCVRTSAGTGRACERLRATARAKCCTTRGATRRLSRLLPHREKRQQLVKLHHRKPLRSCPAKRDYRNPAVSITLGLLPPLPDRCLLSALDLDRYASRPVGYVAVTGRTGGEVAGRSRPVNADHLHHLRLARSALASLGSTHGATLI